MEDKSKEYVAAYLTRLYCENNTVFLSQERIESIFKDFYKCVKEVSDGRKEE